MAPISLSKAAQGETSSTSVDMAGRIMHYWLQNEGDQEFLCANIAFNRNVVHSPSERRDDESGRYSEDEPFDVVNDKKRRHSSPRTGNMPLTPPQRLAHLSSCLTTSAVCSGILDGETVGESSQREDVHNPVSESSLNDSIATTRMSDYNVESTSHPHSEFHRRLNHRRRLQRIRYLAESDDATEMTSLYSQGSLPPSPKDPPDRGSPASTPPSKTISSMKTSETKRNMHTVSFGQQNLVHHFEPDMADASSLHTEEKSEATSIQSEYTKTDESEVEDAIRDLLFLSDGNKSRPGRRKRNDRNLEIGIIKQGATAIVKQKKLTVQSPKRQSALGNAHTSVVFVWQMMEGGMTELVSALGIAPSEDENEEEPSGQHFRKRNMEKYRGRQEDIQELTLPIDLESCETGTTSGEENVTNTVSPSNPIRVETETVPGEEQHGLSESLEGFPFPLSSLDVDPDFAKLALVAARSVHQLQGVLFDESYLIDLYSDLKVSVVELKVPLGLVLMENTAGCFVFKIAPDGSAARSGGVEVGDQLAAINGQRSIKMKVDDVYNSISASSDPVVVQLAFLRYTGPFTSGGPLVSTSESAAADKTPKARSRVVNDKAPPVVRGKKKRRNWFKRR